MSIETIKVEKNGKYGPFANGAYYSFSKFYKGAKEFTVGTDLTVDVYTSDSGKKYINSVVGDAAVAPKVVAPKVDKAVAPKPEGTKTVLSVAKETMSDWAAKDKRISRQGCIQVAVQVTSSFEEAVILAEKMLEFVNKVS